MTDWGGLALNLAVAAGAALAVMLVTFALALRKGVHRIVDVAWGAAFAAVALTSYAFSRTRPDPGDTTLALLATALTCAWGLRLAVHIGRRGRGHGEDPRYARMLAKAPGSPAAYAFRKVYLLQGALVWLVSSPSRPRCTSVNRSASSRSAGPCCGRSGWPSRRSATANWPVSRPTPPTRGRSWTGACGPGPATPTTSATSLSGGASSSWSARPRRSPPPPSSPLVMSALLIFGSGKALLERHMAERPGYAAYRARTSGFFPLPPGKR